jgi:hypothetical protein
MYSKMSISVAAAAVHYKAAVVRCFAAAAVEHFTK